MLKFTELEADLQQIEQLAPTIKSQVETNPYILSASQIQKLKDCISLMRESAETLLTLPIV
jgi:indole-3-glycerol phosphate synthase